jgi:hypothetical protein
MSEGFYIGCLIGAIVASVMLIGGLWVAQLLDCKKREQEIQARLTRAIAKIAENETLLQQEMSHSSKVESDLQFTRQICGAAIEQTLVYFEQNPAIWGEKDRSKIMQELYSALEYTGKDRTAPVALLQHFNGGDNEQPTYTG